MLLEEKRSFILKCNYNTEINCVGDTGYHTEFKEEKGL